MENIERLRATVQAFCQFIEALPEEALQEQIWGPNEILAHLLFHHKGYLSQFKAVHSQRPFTIPKGRFSDLNTQAVAASRGNSITDMFGKFQEANEELCALYHEIDPCSTVLVIRQGTQPRPLAGLIVEIEAHIYNHKGKLEKTLQRRS